MFVEPQRMASQKEALVSTIFPSIREQIGYQAKIIFYVWL